MSSLNEGMVEAIRLIFGLDPEIMKIIGLTLLVTLSSTFIASVLGIPLGSLIASTSFRFKRVIVRTLNTLMGLPPVVAGLIVYLILSRRGPLGSFELLFTVPAMIIAQVLIVTPIVSSLTIAGIHLKVDAVKNTCKGLGLTKVETMRRLLYECRYPILSAVAAGFGRAIAEVGAIMMVGGNIQFKTRVLTTAIVLETGKGNYGKALALGVVLLLIAFIVNWGITGLQERGQNGNRRTSG
jgi:tungstate transport system permease protein